MDDEETSLSEPDLVFNPSRADPLTSGSLVSVPAGSRVKDFVGEGSANVVVGIELPEGTPIATKRFFEGRFVSEVSPFLSFRCGNVVLAPSFVVGKG